MPPSRPILPLAAWRRTSLQTKLTLLARSTANGERGEVAVAKLIELVSLMATFLTLEQRVAVAQMLRDEADALLLEKPSLN